MPVKIDQLMYPKINNLIILLAILCAPAIAEIYNFNCSGNRTIKDETFASGFDMTVNTAPLDINGPMGPMGLCYLTLKDETKSRIKFTCEISANELTCFCSGGDFILDSTHQLSRLTGKLTVISNLKNDSWYGEYNCRKIQNKVF